MWYIYVSYMIILPNGKGNGLSYTLRFHARPNFLPLTEYRLVYMHGQFAIPAGKNTQRPFS